MPPSVGRQQFTTQADGRIISIDESNRLIKGLALSGVSRELGRPGYHGMHRHRDKQAFSNASRHVRYAHAVRSWEENPFGGTYGPEKGTLPSKRYNNNMQQP